MTDVDIQPERPASRPFPFILLLFLIIAALGVGLLFHKDRGLGDCYDKYKRWDWRAGKCS